MKINKKPLYILLALSMGLMTGCKKDFLDRPETTKINDKDYWRNAGDLRLYANDFYINFFVGYNSGFGTDYTPLRGYNFADDFTSEGAQTSFESTVPTTRGSNTATPTMLANYSGPSWNFSWVRKANLMLSRIETRVKPNLSDSEYKHWTSVGRFFRGYEYARLVSVFGDVPYYDIDLDPFDEVAQYRERTNRGEVMDKVYDDFKYVLANMSTDDGKGYVNRYVAAALISNLMLFEGSWQHYHNLDKARAQKYLELAIEASKYVMDSGKWRFASDFKSLFASEDLANNPEVVFFRSYMDALKVTHHIGSYSNGTEVQPRGANLNLMKAFICNDGKVYENSAVVDAKDFSLSKLVLTRDPRFEATFMDVVNTPSSTLLYAHKFADREALTFIGKTYPSKWYSNTNTNDAPVVRLAEVVLNWVEAKAILAESYGGPAVSQSDLEVSINAIRNRPLDAVATAKGVKKTEPLKLNALPNDPNRDADVSALMWEIRRERRMEFVYEYARLNDIRRWKKIDYMKLNNVDYSLGPWINAAVEMPKDKNGKIVESYVKKLQVRNAAGQLITYDGTNQDQLVGYYVVRGFANRVAPTDRNYLSPLGQNEIQTYLNFGYKLSQNPGW